MPSLPWQARFGLLAVPYAAYAMFSGSRWVLVREIVPEESYILARSLMNLADGGMQVAGYGIGGLALLWLSPRGLFAVATFADLVSLVSVRSGLSDRPARTVRYGGAAGRGGVVRRTMTVNRRLLGSPLTRPLYIALWVPERSGGRLRVTVRPVRERGIRQARLAHRLAVASTAAGMMAGDLVIGRFVPPGWRDRIIGPLRLLLAVPYLLFFLSPPPAAAIPLGFGAAAGYAASLPLQDRLIRHTDDAIQGQVLGLHMNGMLVWQAIGALIAGTVASWVPPATAMGVMAAASTAVTLALIPGLRRSGSLLTRAQ